MEYEQYIPSSHLCRSVQDDPQRDYTVRRGLHYVTVDARCPHLCFPKELWCFTQNNCSRWFTRLLGKRQELLKVNMDLSVLGNQLRQALAAAVACYNVWFWFRFEPSEGCEAYIFLFAKVSASSEAQGFYRAFAVFYLTYQACNILIFATNLQYPFPKAKQFSLRDLWELYLSAIQLYQGEPKFLAPQRVDKRKDK